MIKTGIKNPAPKFIHLKKLQDYIVEQKEIIGIEGVRKVISPYLTKQYTYDLFKEFEFEYIHTSNIFTGNFVDDILSGEINSNQLQEKYSFLKVIIVDDIKQQYHINNVSRAVCRVLQERYSFEEAYKDIRAREVKKTEGEGVLYNPRYIKKIAYLKTKLFHNMLKIIDGIKFAQVRFILTNYIVRHFKKPFTTTQINQLQEKKQLLQNILDKENEAVKETKNPLLIEGKAPNILERYTIANELLDIDTTISKLNITSEGKSILLAQIMGCSKQAARELLNGTYNGRAKIRTSTIDNYISNLKK